jgi:hypothetical protein
VGAAGVLGTIPVTAPDSTGYDQDLFGYPANAGRGSCDTRAKVLIRDSLGPYTGTPGFCNILTGKWYSPFDGVVTTLASDLQIDHVVALAETWASGASGWPGPKRIAFGNDLTDNRTLLAVSATQSEAKGDSDSTHWLPPLRSDRCAYIGDWIAIKARWKLTIDPAESAVLRAMLADECQGLKIAPITPPPASLG